MPSLLDKILYRTGIRTHKMPEIYLTDLREDKDFSALYNACLPYTMTSIERMYALYSAMNYVLDSGIPGDFVECGTWRGGSAMMAALIMKQRGITDRKLFLYDTFEGMPMPGAEDVSLLGDRALDTFLQQRTGEDSSAWCHASLEDVQQNLRSTGIADGQVVLVKGKVEESIPGTIPPGPIALLRLDTDWYESTRHEMIHLYPALSTGGVLLIDDFGHWEGAKKAIVEYFRDHGIHMLLNRVDYSARMGIKTSR